MNRAVYIWASIFLLFLPLFSAESAMNFLSKGYADTLYCPYSGGCGGGTNITVVLQNVSGSVNSTAWNRTTDLIFPHHIGDVVDMQFSGIRNVSNLNVTEGGRIYLRSSYEDVPTPSSDIVFYGGSSWYDRGRIHYKGHSSIETQYHGIFINSSSNIWLTSGNYIFFDGVVWHEDGDFVHWGDGNFGTADAVSYFNGTDNEWVFKPTTPAIFTPTYRFETSGDRNTLVINSSGNVGIGRYGSPKYKLAVNGNITAGLGMNLTDGEVTFWVTNEQLQVGLQVPQLNGETDSGAIRYLALASPLYVRGSQPSIFLSDLDNSVNSLIRQQTDLSLDIDTDGNITMSPDTGFVSMDDNYWIATTGTNLQVKNPRGHAGFSLATDDGSGNVMQLRSGEPDDIHYIRGGGLNASFFANAAESKSNYIKLHGNKKWVGFTIRNTVFHLERETAADIIEFRINMPVDVRDNFTANRVDLSDSMVVNGGFDTDTDWTKGTGWVIDSGIAKHSGNTKGDLTPTAPISPIIGNNYKMIIDVHTQELNHLNVTFGGFTTLLTDDTDVTYTFEANTTDSLVITSIPFGGPIRKFWIESIQIREYKELEAEDVEVFGDVRLTGNIELENIRTSDIGNTSHGISRLHLQNDETDFWDFAGLVSPSNSGDVYVGTFGTYYGQHVVAPNSSFDDYSNHYTNLWQGDKDYQYVSFMYGIERTLNNGVIVGDGVVEPVPLFFTSDYNNGRRFTFQLNATEDTAIISGRVGDNDTNTLFVDFQNVTFSDNISMYSPDGTKWNCGVSNTGTFSCS